MKKKFSAKGSLISGAPVLILGMVASLIVWRQWENSPGQHLSESLHKRETALATFAALVYSNRKDPAHKHFDTWMQALIQGGNGSFSALIYVGVVNSQNELQRVWLNPESVKEAIPGQKVKLGGSPSEVFAMLQSGDIDPKGRLESYSVSLPGDGGSLKVGFIAPDIKAMSLGPPYIWFLITVLAAMAAAALGGFLSRGGVKLNPKETEKTRGALLELLESMGVTVSKNAFFKGEDVEVIKETLQKLNEIKNSHNSMGAFFPECIFKRISANKPFPQTERISTLLTIKLPVVSCLCRESSPQKALDSANTYLDVIIETLRERGAVIGEVTLDSVSAWWNNPDQDPNPEQEAIDSLQQLVKELGDLNHRQKTVKEPVLSVIAGVTTGRSLLGRVGSLNRMSTAIVGEPWATGQQICNLKSDEEILVLIDAQTAKSIKTLENSPEVSPQPFDSEGSRALGFPKGSLYRLGGSA